MHIIIAGRRIYVNCRGTQTVKVCTEENARGKYERYYRIPAHSVLPSTVIEAKLRTLTSLADLEEWLFRDRQAIRETNHEMGGQKGNSAGDLGESQASPVEFRVLGLSKAAEYSPVHDQWLISARSAVEQSIDNLVEEFLRHPYLHRCEHSLHVRLCELLKSHQALAGQVPLGFNGEVTQLIHKEWPETLSRNGKPRRGNFDIAILPPKLLASCHSSRAFQYGRLPAPIVVELGLNYSSGHFRDDALKLLNSKPQHGYLVHLVRDRQRDKSTECLIMTGQTRPGIKTAYGWVTSSRTAIKRLDDPGIRENARKACLSASDLKVSSFHEAGHYLYGYLKGIPLDGINMGPDSTQTFRAAVNTVDLQGWIDASAGPERLIRLKLAIGFKLAGQRAQILKFDNQTGTVGESGNDLAHITTFRRQIKEQFPHEDQMQLMDRIQQSVDHALQNPAVWTAMEALAGVLAGGQNCSHDEAVSTIGPYVSTLLSVK